MARLLDDAAPRLPRMVSACRNETVLIGFESVA